MKRSVVQRNEMLDAMLDLGGTPIDLAEYATTGLVAVAVGPRGCGKTNTGLVMAEQLSAQGWVSLLVDPEGELESMYGDAVADPDELTQRLEKRDVPIVVIAATNAEEFVPYGKAILAAADRFRKPVFLFVDEGQIFSAPRTRKEKIGEAADILNEIAEKGRKRCVDLYLSGHRFTGSLHRSIFANKNLLLVGCQEDPTAWSALAPQFRASKIEYGDLNSLAPHEFFCFSRRGVERTRMPMAKALQRVAPKVRAVKPMLPTTYSQWSRAMTEIPTDRLLTLSDPIVNLLGTVAGLTTQQMLSGARALQDELESRS